MATWKRIPSSWGASSQTQTEARKQIPNTPLHGKRESVLLAPTGKGHRGTARKPHLAVALTVCRGRGKSGNGVRFFPRSRPVPGDHKQKKKRSHFAVSYARKTGLVDSAESMKGQWEEYDLVEGLGRGIW